MTSLDYTAVREFVALLIRANWEPRGGFEYLRLSMMPDLVGHLPEGIVVDHTFGPDTDGMVDVRLRRSLGWSL